MVNEPEKRVFLALADTARNFEEDRVYTQLREDIDCIKGPLKVNGLCMYLRRLHVTKPSTVGIRLGGQGNSVSWLASILCKPKKV